VSRETRRSEGGACCLNCEGGGGAACSLTLSSPDAPPPDFFQSPSLQMVAGICCKLMNTLYFKDMITLLYVFIPEIIFINAIFG
jgi:hypothetical protein